MSLINPFLGGTPPGEMDQDFPCGFSKKVSGCLPVARKRSGRLTGKNVVACRSKTDFVMPSSDGKAAFQRTLSTAGRGALGR